MTGVVWIFALLAAMIHIVVFVWESLLIGRPSVHERIFGVPTADVPAIRLWAFGVGFYNLSLAGGMIVGVIMWMAGNETVGRTLVTYICMFMVLGGIVLFIADRLGFGSKRGQHIPGAVAESVPPLVALTAALL